MSLPPPAVLLDFNGTLSRDEPLLDRLFRTVLGEVGIELDSAWYFEHLAGLSDPEIVHVAVSRLGTGADAALERRLLRRKIDLYKQAVEAEPTIDAEAAETVRLLAERGPVAVVSGAFREEIAHQLRLHGLEQCVSVIVAADDVEHGKPDPEGYRLALALLGARGLDLDAAACLAVEDSAAGIASAHAAGLRCVAVRGTADEATLAGADAVVDRLTPALLDLDASAIVGR